MVDPRNAQRTDPKSGVSDDPRVDPRQAPPQGSNKSPGDGAWENELTEEDMPDPAERDDVAHDLNLDPG